jgi:hypothetical protein
MWFWGNQVAPWKSWGVWYKQKSFIGITIISARADNVRILLSHLKKDVEEILKTIEKDSKYGAVNWANLNVVDCQFFIDLDGDPGYNVYIEEASPDSGIGEVVSNRLKEIGWQDAIVHTEW